jgi:limonene-1,2-epoxide hydrolase
MSQSVAVDIVVAYQDAWTSRDFDAARRHLAGDVVFRSSGGQQIRGIDDFIAMLSAFAQRIQPRWENVAAIEDDGGVLILYRLFTADGNPAFCADYFSVSKGRITSDTLAFDPGPFVRPAKS